MGERERSPQRVVRRATGRNLIRSQRKQEAALGIDVELGDGSRGHFARARLVALIDRFVARDQGKDAQRHGDDQRDQRRPDDCPQPAPFRLATGGDVFSLQGGGGRLLALGGAREPALRRVELAPSQEATAVPPTLLPAQRPGEPFGVRSHPIVIGRDCLVDLLHHALMVTVLLGVDVLDRGERSRHIGSGAVAHRHETFAKRERPVQLLGTHGRGDGVGADDEHESVRGLNPRPELPPPGGAGWDVVSVNPYVASLSLERLLEANHERLIPARVGHEGVQAAPPGWLVGARWLRSHTLWAR